MEAELMAYKVFEKMFFDETYKYSYEGSDTLKFDNGVTIRRPKDKYYMNVGGFEYGINIPDKTTREDADDTWRYKLLKLKLTTLDNILN